MATKKAGFEAAFYVMNGVMRLVGEMRTLGLSLSDESIDVSTASSTGRWRELIAGGLKTATITAELLPSDDANYELVRTNFNNSSTDLYSIVFNTGTYWGNFRIATLEFGGEHTDAQTVSMTLESAGVVSYTADDTDPTDGYGG